MVAEGKKLFMDRDINSVLWKADGFGLVKELQKLKVPGYQLHLISTIKKLARATVGDNIIAIADYKGINRSGMRVTLNDIYDSYPGLQTAVEQGTITGDDVAVGITKMRFLGDEIGLRDATCILPDNKATLAAYSNYDLRMPVLSSSVKDMHEIDLNPTRIKANSEIWRKIATYFHFPEDSIGNIRNYDDFKTIAKANNKVIIPLNFARQDMTFEINNPKIYTSKGEKLHGHFELEAAAIFEKDLKTNSSRIVIQHSVNRIWSRKSQQKVDSIIRVS